MMKEIYIILRYVPYEGYTIENNIAYIDENEASIEADKLKKSDILDDFDVCKFIIKE